MEAGDYTSAERCFRQALNLAPHSLETLLNLGYALDQEGRREDALRCYESVLELSPENAKARYNRAAHLLFLGDFISGFADYEFRFAAIQGADNRTYAQPRWDGSPLYGRSILVYCEQGLGDALMFVRFVPLLAREGARVILETQESLVSLLRLMEGVAEVVVKSSCPPVTDVHIPLLSLPFMFHTTFESLPNQIPYIKPPENVVNLWQRKLDTSGAFRVGMVWAGKEKPYPQRSCPPRYLLPLLGQNGAIFYSLQVAEKDRFSLPEEFLSQVVDLTADISDFADTAALIANLDLVITIDTAVAHLAGALGKLVWVLLPFVLDWRWMGDRSDSPWYPTMQLFRQPHNGDWCSVVDAVARKLKETLAERAAQDDLNSEDMEARFQRALQLQTEGMYDSAINLLSAMCAQLPDEPAIWYNLGRAYDLSGLMVKAAESYRHALRLTPGTPAILFRLGENCLKRNADAEAEAYLRRALEQMPNSIEVLLTLGEALVRQDNVQGAFGCCDNMLAIDPENVVARYNLAYLQLRSGDYHAGFANFEARLANKRLKIDLRRYQQPRWDGSPLNGRSILVFGEQGMGDVIQFARYLPLVAERGGIITLELDPPLIPLFDPFPGVVRVLPKSETPPLTDVYIHLLSLPYLFGTTLDTVPHQIPYIVPDAVKRAGWQSALADEPLYRIGLVWRGSPNNPIDHKRSCPLAMFSPLAALSGVRFFSLQVGAGIDEIPSAGIELVDHTSRLKDMSDTAAFIANLDLVIGVDTAVIHLAGAMGKPVWVIVPHVADWRWLMGSSSSVWYPTMRVFWQEHQGDWEHPVTQVRDALLQQVGGGDGANDFEYIEALYNQGCRLKEEGDLAGAECCFRHIVTLDPDLPDAQHSLGVVLHLQGRPREAIEPYRIAVALDPCFVKAHYNLANALLLCGRFEDAYASAVTTIHCDPMYADAHWLLGMLLLQRGDFQNGWREYEWRWKADNFHAKTPDLGRPKWDGSPLNGRSLLIHMEQGRGDMIQFVRFVPLIAATGGKVLVSVVPELVSLLESVEGVACVVSQTDPLPDSDLSAPVLSLPYLLQTSLETIPCTVPYLWPGHAKREEWRRLFPADGRFRVGLVWQGSVAHRDDHNRSCAVTDFLALGDLAGIDYYSLQLGAGGEQSKDLPAGMKVIDLTHRIGDFSDTAALILNLDLVIGVDTAVVHLAGALGKPVWTLLPFVPDWRWLLERDDSPWYPTMRLFRQNVQGDWHSVIDRVRQELSLVRAGKDSFVQQGIRLMKSGRIIEAEKAFSAAVTVDPDNAEAHCNRGVALGAMQRYEDAIDSYRSALSRKPDYIQPLFNMGNACLSLCNPDGAHACYERVLKVQPDFVPAHLSLGDLAKSRRDNELARTHYQNALSIDPSCVDAVQGIAETYQAEEKFERAICFYRTVLAREPGRAGTWNLLGTMYQSLEEHGKAEQCYRQALTLLPDRTVVLNNLGVVLNGQGRIEEAIAVYRHLLEVDNGYADGHWNLAVALLAVGSYPEGWQEYEWRFLKTNPVASRNFTQPRWDGSPLQGKTILLHSEQGFGDTIQFVRYARLMAQRGDRVIIECQMPALKRLLCSLNGVAGIVVAGEPLPPFDCHLPLMSLPLLFGTTLDSMPSDIPYLAAESADVEIWRQRLGPTPLLRVGLVWFAKQSQVLNRKRSCRLELFAPLWTVPGVEFFSLQIGLGAEQLSECGTGCGIRDLTDHISDFADTAGFIANLDLVITIDTAVAHLAGALGVKTWVILPYAAEWRWLCQRHDSPWYPTMRLFRQPCAGDWPGLLAAVAGALDDSVQDKAKRVKKSVPHPELLVGLAWSGRQDNPLNCKRSCPAAALTPLFDIPGITFVNLQMGLSDGEDAHLIDFREQIHDFEDTAALMANLDLVISIDTSVAHLAAALGRPTWVLLSCVADWRWMLHCGDNPWYPGVRFFRQPDHGDWESVIQEVACCLSQFRGNGKSRHGEEMTASACRGLSGERHVLEQQLERNREIARLQMFSPDAHLNVGATLALLGKHAEAVLSFRRVLELSPEHVSGHLDLAYSLLALGEYAEGWHHFEWRLRRILPGQLPPWQLLRPEETGAGASCGTTVLVHCEQGYGDTIMFSRFLPLLARAGYEVIVSCQPPLASLVASVSGVNRVILHGELLPRCDRQVLLLTLPFLFSATLETLPADIPYIQARKELKEAWKARIEEKLAASYIFP